MQRKDLLLVNPPSRQGVYGELAPLSAVEPPVWAGLIAQYVRNNDFDVSILDAEADNLTVNETAECIVEADAVLTVFCVYGHQPSASTQCMPAAYAVLQDMRNMEIKNKSNYLPTMVLGTHVAALPERTLLESDFDYACQGEGPEEVLRTLEVLLGGEVEETSVYGVWQRSAIIPGMILSATKKMPLIDNLSANLPRQAWSLLDMSKYRAHNWHLWTGHETGGYASIQTSLGCPFKCTFCCINAPFTVDGSAPKLRTWSAENVCDQIEELVSVYRITNIKIPDEMFLLDKKHVLDICEGLVKRDLGGLLNMWAYARIDTCNDVDLLCAMREAGFRWLGIGIEAGSAAVRADARKGKFDVGDIEWAIRRVRESGIHVAANYIFGLPGDTGYSMLETLNLAVHLNTEWANFYCAMAYPGSALHRQYVEGSMRVLPEDRDGPGWIGYSQHSFNSKPLPTATLTYQDILDFRDNAHLLYFSRPEYQDMMVEKFGPRVHEDLAQMLARGKPARKHRLGNFTGGSHEVKFKHSFTNAGHGLRRDDA